MRSGGCSRLGAAAARRLHLNAEQLLDSKRVAVLLAHHRNVVQAVEVREGLVVVLELDQLLGAAVQQADVGVGALDVLALELQHQPQHTVRRGVLRAEVEREVLHLAALVVRVNLELCCV